VTTLRQARAVARATLSLWVREVARLLGTSVRTVVAGVVVAVALAAVLGLALAVVAGAQLDGALPVDMRFAIVRTSFASAALTAGAVAVILSLSLPPRTALQNLLDLLPVARTAARLGQFAPILLVGGIYSLALTSTSVVVLLRTSVSPGESIAGIALFLVLLAISLLLAAALFALLQVAALRLFRLPSSYAATVAGVLSLAAVIAVSAPDILAMQSALAVSWGAAELTPSRILARLATAPSFAVGVAGAGWASLAAVLFWSAARLHVPAARNRSILLFRRTSPPRRTPWWGLFWSETLTAIRNPQFVITAMLLPFAIVAVALLTLVPNATPIVPGIAGALPVLPFMLGLYAVGRTLRARWIPTLVTARRAVWIVPAALAQTAVSAAFAVAALGAVVLLGLLPAVQVPDVLLRCALASAVALAGGALVPYSEQQPLSVTAGGFLVGTLYALTSLGIGWAAENAAPGTDRVLVVAAIVAFAGLYALAALRQSVREPARA